MAVLRDALITLCVGLCVALVSHVGPSTAHPTFYARDALNPSCNVVGSPPQIYSFHIHTLFWQTNNDSTNAAFALRDAFAAHFGLSENAPCDDSNTTHPPTTMCLFEPDFPAPAGPFLTCEWSVFVPPPYYAEAVLWMTQRRGTLDIFVHPNSGCEIEDHTLWPLWGGKPWELDVSAFHYDCVGCSMASCRAEGENVMFTGNFGPTQLPAHGGAVPLDIAARDLRRASRHGHVRAASQASAHAKRTVASMQKLQSLPYQQCGLATSSGAAGAPFQMADSTTFCSSSCLYWAQQMLTQLPVDCPHNCDLFSGDQQALCASYLATIPLLPTWVNACGM